MGGGSALDFVFLGAALSDKLAAVILILCGTAIVLALVGLLLGDLYIERQAAAASQVSVFAEGDW